MKGTPSMGKRNKTVHVLCRRCGRRSFHQRKRRCSSCGFGLSASRYDHSWARRQKGRR
jgi:large subunit ribosomal protein L37e